MNFICKINKLKVVYKYILIFRVESRKKAKHLHLMKQNMEGIKYLWFKDHLDPNITECTREMLADLIEQ